MFSDKDSETTWLDYFKHMFDGQVTEESIKEYEKKFKDSEEERLDVLSAYCTFKGDMFKVIDSVPCSTLNDIERYQGIITSAIKSGEVQDFPKYLKINPKEFKKRQKQALKEAKEAEIALQEMKKESVDQEDLEQEELKKLIMTKNKQRMEDMVQNLEEKYTKRKPPTIASSSSKKTKTKK